jgi:hypothetical protein
MTHRLIGISLPLAFSAALALAGCNGTSLPAAPTGTPTADHKDDGHAHGHAEEGPHHGHLIELGEEEYHAELTHDEATKTVTVYLLDKEAKGAVGIADAEIVLNLVADGQPTQVKLAAAPQEGDPAGQSTRFSITDEKVLEMLEGPKTTGRLNVTINGKAYSGTVEHHEHGEHKH